MNKNYNLTLADGSTWLFHAEASVSSWLDDLAEIMELVSGEISYDNFFYFYSSEDKASGIVDDKINSVISSEKQWDYYFNGSPIHLWINKYSGENIIELDKSFFHIRDMFYLNMTTSLTPLFLYSIKNGGTPVHAALAVYKDKGILIAATGDTGKTTCCKRLPEDEWTFLCDDLSLLIKDSQGEICAHPLPTWSDYMVRKLSTTWEVEKYVPVRAIFFLEQSTSDKVIPISKLETSIRLLESAKQALIWDMDDAPHLNMSRNNDMFNSTQQIAKTIPAYILHATLTGEFWKHIEEVI